MPHLIGRRAVLAMPSQPRCHIAVPLTRAVLGPILCRVTVNPVAGCGSPNQQRRDSAHPSAGAFFVPAERSMAGRAGEPSGSPGSFAPVFHTLRGSSPISRVEAGGGELLTSAKEFHHV
ncbi:hypothetical protein D3C85_1333200 [compost metagenome]